MTINTVYICYLTGEEAFTCAVFSNEEDAIVFCQEREESDEYGYQYNYKQWEVK
jgi:hypothetical protein